MNFQTKEVKLTDIAEIERAKKGKEYPPCPTVQLSGTKGELQFHSNPGEVSTRYAVVIPKTIDPAYLMVAMKQSFDEFIRKYLTTINLQFETLYEYTLRIHTEKQAIEFVANVYYAFDKLLQLHDRFIELLKLWKKWMLEKMFVGV